jgi:HEAT repeat protein
MKKKIFQYTALLILVLLGSVSVAQDNRTLDVKVTDVIAQMPAGDLIYLDQLVEELIDLGVPGFDNLQQRLTPPGEGDDTAVRFAINSMARYASKFGREKERDFVEINLLEAIENHSDFMVKTFLLNQLNLVAGNKSVAVISKYLSDEQLVEPAVQTLLSVKTNEASRALLGALPDAGEQGRVTILKALGERQCMDAAEAIADFADAKNQNLKKTALAALANIGNPGSYNLLLKAAKNADFDYEPTNAAEAFLNYADHLGEKGEIKLCQKALKSIIRENRSGKLLHNYAEALSIYAKYFGYKAMPLLLEAVESNDKALRVSVLNIAESIGGIAGTREWTDKARNVSPEIKAEIIYMLGNRGDAFAVDFVKENLNFPDATVRKEALSALVKLNGKKAVPVLTEHLIGGRDISAAKNEFLQLLDRKHLHPVAVKLDKTSGHTKTALIDLIAAKAGNEYFNEILKLTNSKNSEERTSAFNALKFISTPDNLEDLIRLLLSAEGENEISQVQAAVIAAAGDNKAERTEKGKLLQALKNTDKKERILAVLPETGGDIALKTITKYFNNSGGQLKDAAFEALTSWKDYSASESLYSVCQTNKGKYGDAAFKSFVRQINSADIPDDQKLLQFRKIMPYAGDAEAKKLVITSIGNLKTFLSLVYLEQFLDDAPLQQTAARSVMKIALPDSNGKNGFTGDKVRELLNKAAVVIKGEESEYDKINIKNYLEEMPGESGFVSMFNGKDIDGWQGNKTDYIPENGELLVRPERGGHGNLYTAKEYSDFIFRFEFQLTPAANNGLGIRAPLEGNAAYKGMELQILDNSAPVYANLKEYQYHGSVYGVIPAKCGFLRPVGEWNEQEVFVQGNRVKVTLNGTVILDGDIVEASKNGTMDGREHPGLKRDKGYIGFLGHGSELKFRNIRIKDMEEL